MYSNRNEVAGSRFAEWPMKQPSFARFLLFMKSLPKPTILNPRKVKRRRERALGATAPHSTGPRGKPGWRRLALTFEGWCYVIVLGFVFFGALIRDINLLMLLFGLLAGVFAYSFWYVRWALRRVRAERHLPVRLVCGVTSDVQVTAVNPRRWLALWSVALEDRTLSAGPWAGEPAVRAGLLFWRLPPRSSQRLTYRFCPSSRGKCRFGPLSAVTRFPLGLVRGSRLLAGEQEVLVWPALGRLQVRSRRWIGQGDRSTAQSSAARAGRLGEFHSLRDWRPGDSPRWVHWRTTARVGELMVRQFEQHRDPELALLLDLWQPRDASTVDRAAVETAVSFAATLLSELCRRRGARISVLLPPASPLCVHRVANPVVLAPLLDELAVAPTHAETFANVLRAGSAASRPTVPTLLVSTRDPEAARPVVDQKQSGDARLMNWLRRVETVAVRSPAFQDYFASAGSNSVPDDADIAALKTAAAARDFAPIQGSGTSLFDDPLRRIAP
jgi:uncharacterized protein (DUF58 family)